MRARQRTRRGRRARGLDAADVVVVTGHGGASLAYADVVLPAAVQHERLGTVTNIEGRVTASHRRSSPRSAWPDVAIASELAEELDRALGSRRSNGRQDDRGDHGYPALSVLNDSTSDAWSWVTSRSAPRVDRWIDGVPRNSFDRSGRSRCERGTTVLADVATMTSATPATLGDLGTSDKLEVRSPTRTRCE